MNRFIASLMCATIVGLTIVPQASADIVTFEDLALAGSNAFQNGSTLSPPGSFQSGGASLNNFYDKSFDFWSGWSFSNVKDATTPGFGNQYAAFAPSGGDASAQYGVAFAFSQGDATIALPNGQRPTSLRVANTTYASLSMKDGDPFSKKFGGASGDDPDFFLLTIIGQNALSQITGVINFYLADFRFADKSQDYIVADWTSVNLTSLGSDTTRLSFGLSSSDNGPFGMNTPAYFAMDNLQLTAIPEPGSLGLVAIVGLGAAGMRFVRRRRIADAQLPSRKR